MQRQLVEALKFIIRDQVASEERQEVSKTIRFNIGRLSFSIRWLAIYDVDTTGSSSSQNCSMICSNIRRNKHEIDDSSRINSGVGRLRLDSVTECEQERVKALVE